MRGYWSYISPGTNDSEIGTSKFSGKLAVATSAYQVEVTGKWEEPVTVFDKSTRPFTTVSNPQEIRAALEMVANTIPKETLDYCAKVYGNRVREKQAVASADYPTTMFKKAISGNERTVSSAATAAIKAPFVINDAQGNNFADGIRKNPDNSFTIFGRNCNNQPRQLTLFQDGRSVGYNPEAPLSVVENQFLTNSAKIFNHFGHNIHEEIPILATSLRP